MILEYFRIQNFRSIVDTGWIPFSHDNVTVLVGQNESGKTSILEALSKTFSSDDITDDDTRTDSQAPIVAVKVKSNKQEFIDHFSSDYEEDKLQEAAKVLDKLDYKFEIQFTWSKDTGGGYDKEQVIELDDAVIEAINLVLREEEQEEGPVSTDQKTISKDDMAQYIYDVAPYITLFNRDNGTLPDRIDILDDFSLEKKGGKQATENFLEVAGIDLKSLLSDDSRKRKTKIDDANKNISEQFSKFWTQKIGTKNKIKVGCEIEHYQYNVPDKSGKPCLAFYVHDGKDRFYFRQRSGGVKWFFSFFLQLKAIENDPNTIFLLDEPGANLHIKAQRDALNLMNELGAKKVPLVYSTHSPDMIEDDKFYRIRAVERSDVDDAESPTIVKTVSQLSQASEDTLSPILKCMGASFYHQSVIQKKNNVILEELSAFYYMKAFYKLTNKSFPVHFIPCNGVTNVTKFAYMFIGWGLDYVVVVDDDTAGRSVYNSLKKELYQDDNAVASKHIYKVDQCSGIEDVFSPTDFCQYVLGDASISIPSNKKVSDFMKDKAKPLPASQFLEKVANGDIKLNNFDRATQDKINSLMATVERMLNPTNVEVSVIPQAVMLEKD